MQAKGQEKVTNAGGFGAPSIRHVESNPNDATAEGFGRSALGASGAVGDSHSPNPATTVYSDMGFMGDKGGGGSTGSETKGSGDEEGLWGWVGKGDKWEWKGSEKGKGEQESTEDMEEEEVEEKTREELRWEEVTQRQGIVMWRSDLNLGLRLMYDSLKIMEEETVKMIDPGFEMEEGVTWEDYFAAWHAAQRMAVEQFEEMVGKILKGEERNREINKKGTNIMNRLRFRLADRAQESKQMREELKEKEKDIEELEGKLVGKEKDIKGLEEVIKGKDKEIEELKEYIKRTGTGVMGPPRPETAERGTSPQRNKEQDNLRVMVRELVREEMVGLRRDEGGEERRGRERGEKQREGSIVVRGKEDRAPLVPAVITVRGSGSRTYADVMGTLRREVPIENLGTDSVDVRVTPSGAARITLTGATRDIARRVAGSFREVLGAGATVTCPCPMETIEVAGFDLSIRETELAAAIQKEWQVSAPDLWIGKICRTRGGAGRALVRLPSIVARRARREGLRVGWCRARAYELASRVMQCFRCLGFGHNMRGCVATVIASEHPVCYNCSKPGHPASSCIAPSSCAACGLRGWSTDHRMGSPACLTLAAYTSRSVPGGVGEKASSQGAGVAALQRPPARGKRPIEETALSSVEGGQYMVPPAKTIALTPPVGGPRSGLPPEGLDPGEEGVVEMEVEDLPGSGSET